MSQERRAAVFSNVLLLFAAFSFVASAAIGGGSRPAGGQASRGLLAARRLLYSFLNFGLSLTLCTAQVTANRTFVRLVALSGACAALRIAAAVCVAGYCAWVKPAGWPVAPVVGARGVYFRFNRLSASQLL